MVIILILIGLFYLIHTFRFAVHFNKTDVLYTNKQRFIHNIAIWLVPFIWIAILKQAGTSTPGSHQIIKKRIGASDYNQASSGYSDDSYEPHGYSSSEGGSDTDGD